MPRGKQDLEREAPQGVQLGNLWSPDSATFPVLLFAPGTFPVFHVRKTKKQKMSGVRLLCAAPLPDIVNSGSYLPADPSSP